jgi:hypothetical protein
MEKDARDALLGIVWIVVFVALFLGMMGQAGLSGAVLKPHLPVWIGAFLIIPPWLIVFVLAFFWRPILPPRPFRRCLVLAMCWIAVVTIIAEAWFLLGYMPPDSPKFAGTIGRVLMHIGWLGFIPLCWLCAVARRFERLWDRRARRAVNPPSPNPDSPAQ